MGDAEWPLPGARRGRGRQRASKPGGVEQIKRDIASPFERELRPDPMRR
jgi:hypothetical protein